MERLDFTEESRYIAIESAIHFNRYFSAKPFVEGKKVLDIACGEGYGSKLMKDWGAKEVIGIDISEVAIKVANEKFSGRGITYIQHPAEQIPFAADSFDLVVSFETIEYLEDPEAYLLEISRVLKFNGVAIVSCPNDPYYYKNGEAKNPFHKRTFNWSEFAEMTQRYLGKNVDWYFGFALNGFTNVPLAQCRLPEKPEATVEGMEGLFEYQELEHMALVPSDCFINHWNCNYYLGVWGGGQVGMQTSTVFPREFFRNPEEPIFADINQWNQEFEQKQDVLVAEKKVVENRLKEVEEEQRIVSIEKLRSSILLELANKENMHFQQRIQTFEENEYKLKQQIQASQEEAICAKNDIEIIKSTKGYCMLRKCWNIIDRLKGMPRKS